MRILILGPYPIGKFRHGGQLRASEIVRAYRAAGHAVLYAGVYDPANTPPGEATAKDHPITQAIARYVHVQHAKWSREIAVWTAFAEVPEAFVRFAEQAADFRPDMVQFEEPYLWPVVRSLRGRGFLDSARVVYSAHNVESSHKRKLAAALGRSDDHTIRAIMAMEAEIAQSVDQIYAVSAADEDAFLALGARRVAIVPNGARPLHAKPGIIAALGQYFGAEPFALFVSSAHPLNARGLIDLIEEAPSVFLKQGSLVICGDVARLIVGTRSFDANQRIFARTRFFGRVDDDVLSALYALARVIILPKTLGGGSNLKTAEALVAARPIVATSLAFVAFESYSTLPDVAIEDSGTAFWSRVVSRLATKDRSHVFGHPDQSRRGLLSGLHWDECLVPMVKHSEALVDAGAPPRE
jgi:hypothetical protein